MASRFSKKHLFWFVPALLVVLLAAVLVGGLAWARMHGWRWQGLAWRDGPALAALSWHEGDCPRWTAQDIRISGAWPLQLAIGHMQMQPCAAATDTGAGGFALPSMPPFDVTVHALEFRQYAAVQVVAHHRGSRWWARIERLGSHVQASYDTDSRRWQIAGRVAVADIRQGYVGTLELHGGGYWRPTATAADQRFGGRLRVTGQQLGRQQRQRRVQGAAAASWRGQDWTLDVALTQPLALGAGWVVRSEQGIHASGSGLRLDLARAAATLRGPQGEARVTLRSDAGRLGSGRGNIVFSGGAAGRIDLRWFAGNTVEVQPFTVTGPRGVTLALNDPVTLAAAAQGRIRPDLTVSYRDARLRTTRSVLTWNGMDVGWRGAVELDGHWQGYALAGSWSGTVDRNGLHGEPLVATLHGANLQFRVQLPVTRLWPAQWPVTAQLEGRFMGQSFAATLSARPADAGWRGHVQAHGRLSRLSRDAKLTFSGDWRWQDGLVVDTGAQLQLAGALVGDVLIEPMHVTATTPIRVSAGDVHGRLRLQAKGVTAARWMLPSLQADIKLDGTQAVIRARVPQWDGSLTIHGGNLFDVPAGTFSARLPLQPAVSRGLGVIVRNGLLVANGHWQLGRTPSVSGRLQVSDARLDWGSITALGVRADLGVRWRPGSVHLKSRAPVTVAAVNSGIALTDVRFGLTTDIETWTLHDVSAHLLGGRLSARTLTWPSAEFQPVALSSIDVGQIVALQSKPVVAMSGQIGGTIPLRLLQSSLAIRDGHLYNATPLHLSIPETGGVRALKQTSQAVGLALDVISTLRIDMFKAKINMDADGWLNAKMTIKGVNPRLGQPIVLNYTHQENMFDLLRNLRIGGRVVDAVIGDHDVAPAPE